MKIAVSAAAGLEAVVKRELKRLGIDDAPAVNGRIIFDGEIDSVMKCNLFLSSASRVYVVLSEFPAGSFDELFDGVYSLPWREILPLDAKIAVEAKCVHSKLHAVSAVQSVAKRAVCNKLTGGKSYATEESEAVYNIEISVLKDYAAVSLNTSGAGLNRRGYRTWNGEAPLSESVASALIELSVWNPTRPFYDLFCGSGTLPIEAALKAKGIPAGARRDFDFLHWAGVDARAFEDMKQEAISRLNDVSGVTICGFDVDDKALTLARRHARAAGVDDIIHFQRADARDFSSKRPRGVVISNPPYGERLMNRREIESLYRDYGRLAASYPDYCFYTITPVRDFERLFGRKADKRRKIYNGSIECVYYAHLAPKKKS